MTHTRPSSGRWFWGFVLIAFGVLLLLDNLDILSFHDVFHDFWPLLLIAFGVSILLRGRQRNRTAEWDHSSPPPGFGEKKEDSSSNVLDYSNVFGDVEVRATSSALRGGTVSTVFGDVTVDLAAASLADGESALTVNGVFGNVTVMIPANMPCSISANATLGKVRINDQKTDGFSPSSGYESPEFATASRRLRVTVSQVFGDAVVTHG